MQSQPRVVYQGRAELAEGPVWHDGALWWVDIACGTLNRLDPATGLNTSRGTGGYLGAACPTADGRWLLARQHDCALMDWQSGRFTPLASPRDGVAARHRFNDGKCDPAGRFWVGTMSLDRKPDEASLFCIEHDGAVRRVLRGLSLSNGLAWSPDGRAFYHADTPTRRVQKFDFDVASGVLSNPRLLIQFGEADGWPDGMTSDAEGHLWIGLWGGRCVVRVHGETGGVMERHELPVSNVSSCTFGEADLRTLFITTAWEGFDEAQRQKEPLAGSIFALRTHTQGVATHCFGQHS
jgi:sugar lactone lactonase YvrE